MGHRYDHVVIKFNDQCREEQEKGSYQLAACLKKHYSWPHKAGDHCFSFCAL